MGRAFQDRYRIIALDQRGHGESAWPAGADFATDDYVADVEALVDGWGLKRFDMIGLSMGGMNGIAYAARHPERVGHLGVIDIPPAVKHEKRPSRQLDKHIAEHGHPVLENPDAGLALIRRTNQPAPGRGRYRRHEAAVVWFGIRVFTRTAQPWDEVLDLSELASRDLRTERHDLFQERFLGNLPAALVFDVAHQVR